MKVAIVGTGISGITLALRLQQLGIETTVLAECSTAEARAGKARNFVARFPKTLDRERELGVAHWDGTEGAHSFGINLDVVGTPLGFQGRLRKSSQGVDFRVYLSQLTDDYVERGGRLRVGPLPVTEADLVARTVGHDAVVVAVGREAPVTAALFPVRADRSPYSAPQRQLLGGLFWGVEQTDPPMVSYNIAPGAGEIFQQPFLTDRGPASAILVEAIPGGPLETDVAGMLDTITEYAPNLAARIDPARFAPLGDLDVLRGAVTPVVRDGWAELEDGRIALAIGDAWITNDPITGQGANVGSHCAWELANLLTTTDRVDKSFARIVEDELWKFAGPVTAWTNGFLAPPPPHTLDLLGAATADQSVADAFANGFADPARLAGHLATPEATAAFVRNAPELVDTVP